ncbi:hypothetical protein BZL29_7255 [Mycobacterium kansasii]|uniref:Uncharacterized protein n=1 Tax=Mycobacterium kansasii TaxID=1768 RepID=A0A1V3WK68_MYCKA|nr:hypothetical protein BZL29_7255 [Mycobacterium kansasii]
MSAPGRLRRLGTSTRIPGDRAGGPDRTRIYPLNPTAKPARSGVPMRRRSRLP